MKKSRLNPASWERERSRMAECNVACKYDIFMESEGKEKKEVIVEREEKGEMEDMKKIYR